MDPYDIKLIISSLYFLHVTGRYGMLQIWPSIEPCVASNNGWSLLFVMSSARTPFASSCWAAEGSCLPRLCLSRCR